ncbi:MAG: hypothetical protein R3234_13005, partial [Thermoanaerobaculia bacterium]|nr:hypothetical protein [Thermoanaerobaculia bacterium]
MAGTAWDSPLQFRSSEISAAAVSDLDRMVAGWLERAEENAPWVAEDPVFCLTSSLWRPYLTHTVVALAIRDPVQVGRWIERIHGYPLQLGVALWEYYHLEAVEVLDGLRVVVIHMGELGRELEQGGSPESPEVLRDRLEEVGFHDLKPSGRPLDRSDLLVESEEGREEDHE